MTANITGSMLYDLVQCPHRVTMDLFGDYVAGDIKSGSGKDGGDDDNDGGKLKKHYAMQLALYTDILERKGVHSVRGGCNAFCHICMFFATFYNL